MSRRLDVALRPDTLDAAPAVAVVVDVLRASTSLVTLVERGAGPIRVASTVEAALRAASGAASAVSTASGTASAAESGEASPLLIGERSGRRPEGFDYGNSPAELAAAPVAGRAVLFATTNGAPALHAAASAPTVLVGCLRNAAAAAREAWEALAASEASTEGPVVVVCAGRSENPGGFGVDDLYAAGVIVERVCGLGEVALTDAAEAARLLAAAEPDPLRLFGRSAAGRHIAILGLWADVEFAAQVDRSVVVPRLGRHLVLLDPPGGLTHPGG